MRSNVPCSTSEVFVSMRLAILPVRPDRRQSFGRCIGAYRCSYAMSIGPMGIIWHALTGPVREVQSVYPRRPVTDVEPGGRGRTLVGLGFSTGALRLYGLAGNQRSTTDPPRGIVWATSPPILPWCLLVPEELELATLRL